MSGRDVPRRYPLRRHRRTGAPREVVALAAALLVSLAMGGCGGSLPDEQAGPVSPEILPTTADAVSAPAASDEPPTDSAASTAASETAVPKPDAPKTDVSEAEAGPGGARGARRDTPAERPTGANSAAPSRRVSFPLRAGAVNDITFDDLELDMPIGTLFDRAMLTPRAAQLDGQRVRIRGFIYAGGVFQQTGITSFPLVKNTECKFGPQGEAFCVILVDLDEGVKTNFTTYPVTVEGTLTVRPFDSGGFTWSVYHLQGRRVF